MLNNVEVVVHLLMLVTCLSWLLFNNQLFIKGNLIFGDFVRGVAWGGLAKSKFFIKTGPFLDISTKGEGFFGIICNGDWGLTESPGC